MRDTIDMAREADEYADMEWPLRPRGKRWQKCRDERLEDLVRADEREACAKVCEQTDEEFEGPDQWDWHSKDYAKAIRARGETK
jgi:hypothetical protein